MTRDELTRKILAIKRAKGVTWKTIVAEIGGGSAVYLTAALMGQMRLRPDQASARPSCSSSTRPKRACCRRFPIAARCRAWCRPIR